MALTGELPARAADGETPAAAAPATAGRPRAGFWTKVAYGVGGMAYGAKDSGFSYFLLLFYSQVLGVDSTWVGAALMGSLLIDAVLDPLVGQLSDHWRSRWGRRHPFMYLAAVPSAACFYLLWNPPSGLAGQPLLIWLFALAVLVRMCISFYEIPSGALIAELTADYDERTSFFGFRVLFGYAGALLTILCAYAVFLQPDAAHPVGQLNPVGYGRYGALASAVILVSILVSSIGTHRFVPWLNKPPARTQGERGRWVREAAQTLSNRSFLMLLGLGVFSAIAGGMGSALDVYVNTYFWQFGSSQIAVLVSSAGVGSLVGPFLAPALSRRMGKKLGFIALACGSVVCGLTPTGLRLAGLLEPGSAYLLPLLFATTVLQSSLSMASIVLVASMTTDVVEDSALATGRRSEGLLGAANTFIQKCVSGLGIFAGGLVLSVAQFPKHATPGPATWAVARHLVLIYLPLQITLFAIAIAFCAGYRITRERHAENLRQLAARSGGAEGR